MENNNILKTERKIIKRLPNPNKYPTKNRERHTRKLGRYIANYALSENANIKNRVTRFNALRRQIANLPPYEATENAGTLNEGVEEALAGLRLLEAPALPSVATKFEERLAAMPSMSAPAELITLVDTEPSTSLEAEVPAFLEAEAPTPLDVPVEAEAPLSVDCAELFDPCTREPIENGDINILDKRVRDIKKLRLKELYEASAFPDIPSLSDKPSRWELLLFILNRKGKPDEGLLQYNINGQLYEAYWDIVFALGLADNDFPITKDFFMFNQPIETLTNIDGAGFLNNPYEYLQDKINIGSKRGASDVTFVYKKNKYGLSVDPCSSDPSIIVRENCARDAVTPSSSKDEKPLFYFCSSKYFKRDETKGVDKFDIQNIYTAAKNLQQDYDRRIVLLVRDRGAVEEKLRKAMRKYISEEASYVFGMTDLFAYLTVLYDRVHTAHKSAEPITSDELKYILNIESPPKPILKLRLHQYIATYKICDAIQQFKTTGGNNKFLVGIVPRGGKTFIAGGIIDKLNPRRVVVLLGAKSETLSQFKKDLFEEFQNFQDYECVDVVNSTNVPIDPAKKYIFVMSVELYKQPESARLLLQELKGGALRADLFICDEAHLKQTTARAVRAQNQGTVRAVVPQEEEVDATDQQEKDGLKELDNQIERDVPVVYMTGTYIKPLTAFKIPDNNVVIWDYQDIQQAKELSTNEEYFRENFGELYNRALQTCISYGQTYETIQEQYRKFPELYLLTTQFTPDAKAAFSGQTGGFPTLSHLFEVRRDFDPQTTAPELWYTGFSNPKGILRLLNYLAPPSQQINTVDGEPVEPISSVLKSIDIIAQRIGDRLGFFTSEFVTHSQLWFLPHMEGHPLYKRMCALAGAIFQLPWFRKYFHVLAVSSSVKWAIQGSERNSILIRATDGTDSCGLFSWGCPTSGKSLKQCLIDEEAYARSKGKGLIILALNMLHLGISLPCVDIVVLLDIGQKVDERIQKMYRALTESTNKKGGYIVDMNYFRTVNAIMQYQITAEKSRKGKKEVYSDDIPKIFNKVLDIFSIDIDKPIYGTREERMSNNSDIQKTTIPELEKMLKGSKSSGDSLLLKDAAVALNENVKGLFERDYISSYDEFLGFLEKEKQRLVRKEGNNVKGAEHSSDKVDEENEANEESVYPEPIIFRQDEEDKREAYIDIFKTTLKLGAFGTNSGDITTLKNRLESDENLREILYDTLIKRGSIEEDISRRDLQKDFIIHTIVIPGLIKMISNGKEVSYHAMKESINDEGKYPVEVEKVLDYIKEHLAAKDIEREKYGEVFTPMSLVNEMLDTLPDNVWNDNTLRWLDPANGMGNFPIAAFLRLFYGFRIKDGKYIGIGSSGEGTFNPGLTNIIKNDNARRTHIIKNMLFMVELNNKNIIISKRLFSKLAPNVEPNIIQIDRVKGFLADVSMKFPNGVINEFDIIMGNPPYNVGGLRIAGKKKTVKVQAGGGKTIWNAFVIEAYKRLKPNGHLLYIHPVGWFHSGDYDNVRNILLNNQLDIIKIYHKTQAKKEFSGRGEITVAYYHLEKKKPTKETIIIGQNRKKESIMLNTNSIIMLNDSAIIAKCVNNASFWKDNVNFKHKSINCVPGSFKQISGVYDDGFIKYVKTLDKHIDQDKPKIIVSGATYPRIYYDKDGEYGLAGSGPNYWIGTIGDLDKIHNFLKTKLAALLTKELRFRAGFVEFKYFPDVTKLALDTINDKTLADHFKFTKEERDIINSVNYPDRIYKFQEITCAVLNKEPVLSTGGSRRKTRKLRRR